MKTFSFFSLSIKVLEAIYSILSYPAIIDSRERATLFLSSESLLGSFIREPVKFRGSVIWNLNLTEPLQKQLLVISEKRKNYERNFEYLPVSHRPHQK